MKNYDVVIVGAGIIGLSIAWQLVRRSKLKIAVLEKGAGVGEGSTGASSAVCRCRYSLDELVYLARDGINAYRNWAAFTGLDEPRATFNNDGVLWMPGSDTQWAEAEHQRMQMLGIATEVLDDLDIKQRFPALNSCVLQPDFVTGEAHECQAGSKNFFETEGGYVDPVSAAQDLVEACRKNGVDIHFKTQVTRVEVNNIKLKSIKLNNSETLSMPLLVNAAGPWCKQLYQAAGLKLDWDLSPVRIQVLHRDRPQALQGHIPITVDMQGGIYFRTQNRGQQLLVGSVLEEDEREIVADPDNFRTETDQEFELLKFHALHHRLPQLPYRGTATGYCGLYTVNRADVHPIVGPTNITGFWVANGFSGHGFKLAPAIGSMLAQAITGDTLEFDTRVPMSFLGVDREPIKLESKSVLA